MIDLALLYKEHASFVCLEHVKTERSGLKVEIDFKNEWLQNHQ